MPAPRLRQASRLIHPTLVFEPETRNVEPGTIYFLTNLTLYGAERSEESSLDKFDAIVVGAGPAGCASAWVMARSGLNVLVFERGKYAGAKNMWGGAFFGPQLNDLFPDFWKEAPVERFVNRHVISFLTPKGSISVDFKSARFGIPPYNGFILLRAKFDQWMAKKVEQAGAIVAAGLQVDDLLLEGNQVKGVRAGSEEFTSDVVILADGANSLLTEKAGLRSEVSSEDMKQGVKEVIQLPRKTLEDRFNLRGDEGVAMEFVGDCTQGLPGGGFLYTNKESLSLGIVAQLSELAKNKVKASDLLERFKGHPEIGKWIEGGKTLEYSAHLIPCSGLKMMPRLSRDGLLVTGDAASLLLGTGLILEGSNFAIASGMAAAETVKGAREKNDFSAQGLAGYEEMLKRNFVLRDLETFKEAPEFLKNPRIYNLYPELLVEMAEKVFRNDGEPRKRSYQLMREVIKEKASVWQLLSDAMKGRKAI
jgi:electron transfer flavoprotein-quinone oxidoreductase